MIDWGSAAVHWRVWLEQWGMVGIMLRTWVLSHGYRLMLLCSAPCLAGRVCSTDWWHAAIVTDVMVPHLMLQDHACGAPAEVSATLRKYVSICWVILRCICVGLLLSLSVHVYFVRFVLTLTSRFLMRSVSEIRKPPCLAPIIISQSLRSHFFFILMFLLQ